jgi:hypothetical protein
MYTNILVPLMHLQIQIQMQKTLLPRQNWIFKWKIFFCSTVVGLEQEK